MPANLENSAVVTGLEKVSFHSNPKERQCQRISNYHTILLISHSSKVILKILQARLHYKLEFLCGSGTLSPGNAPCRPSYTVEQLSQGPHSYSSNPLWILLPRGCSPTVTKQVEDNKACCSRRHKLLCQLTLTQELPDSFAEPLFIH